MRTTLDIDEAVLGAVKELARRQGKTAGEVISTLARQALTQAPTNKTTDEVREPPAAYGFRPFPAGDALVTNETIDKLRDELGV
jgi:hypothetical protein